MSMARWYFLKWLELGTTVELHFLVTVYFSVRSENSVYKCTSFKMNTQISTLFPSLVKSFSLQIFFKNILIRIESEFFQVLLLSGSWKLFKSNVFITCWQNHFNFDQKHLLNGYGQIKNIYTHTLESSFVLFCFTSCINVHSAKKFQVVEFLKWCFFSGFILLHVPGVQTFLAPTGVKRTTFPTLWLGPPQPPKMDYSRTPRFLSCSDSWCPVISLLRCL